MTRDEMIIQRLPQVRYIAGRIHARLPVGSSLDDLISVGVVGLIGAVDNFDSSRKCGLSAYAQYRIQGEILDALRRLDWKTRSIRNHVKRIEVAASAVGNRLQRSPTDQEIASEMKLTMKPYYEIQAKISMAVLRRVEAGAIVCNPVDQPDVLLERKELLRALSTAISNAPARDQAVLKMYFHDELTMREIGKIIGVNESRVSYIRARAIRRLRDSMAELWPSGSKHDTN